MSKLLIIIPAYNEEKSIESVINNLSERFPQYDYVIINDGSKDDTLKICEENGYNVISHPINLGLECGIKTGMKYAYRMGYDYVIQFDADGQHIAKEAEKLYQYSKKNNCDIVIGSRYLENTGYPCPLFRRIGTKIFEKIIKFFCHKKIADPLSGFQCLNKRVIKRYSEMGKYPEFPDANLVIEMLLLGFKIEEVPVKMRLREVGESMHSGIIKPIKYMINMFYNIFFILITHKRGKGV